MLLSRIKGLYAEIGACYTVGTLASHPNPCVVPQGDGHHGTFEIGSMASHSGFRQKLVYLLRTLGSAKVPERGLEAIYPGQ